MQIPITQLLERNLITADNAQAGNYLHHKTVLITGAAGSVGSELARRMQALDVKQVLLLDYAESALYELEWELKHFFPALNFVSILANVADRKQIESIFADFKPEIIFHTAAYKQVPLLEKYPQQAVFTNIIGTKNIADLALEFGAEKMIFISTDKAVNPVSVMGVSKKLAEMYIQGLCQTKLT
ncbi:MAG: SDR family NAD(P)-dependent oxidoreductase, partial [Verrucomicrobia bacterium]|nr:SDR family NAD(P)-dependent oxidoreductase [Cytophagales bacterium]